jgi:hypothetical protein
MLSVTEYYPDLLEHWTLVSTIKALVNDDAFELYTVHGHMNRNDGRARFVDVHPSGKVYGATVERVGLGFAPTLSVLSRNARTSIWYDKYVGVSLNGYYWPRPDIVIRSGTYDLIRSATYETRAGDSRFVGEYSVRRGRNFSDSTKGWRSLSDLVLGDPELIHHSTELSNNFKVTKELVKLQCNETGEAHAFAGRPLEALPSNGIEYLHGQIEGDCGTIFWARRTAFLRPDAIIECKSGLLTPHALEQIAAYREVLPSTPLIVVTTRLPDQSALRMFTDLEVRCISSRDTLRKDFWETLQASLKEAKASK